MSNIVILIMKKFFAFILVLVIIASIFSYLLYSYADKKLDEKISIATPTIIDIPTNCTLENAVNILNKHNIFEPTWLYNAILSVYSKIKSNYLLAGSYLMKPGMSNKDVLSSIFSGTNLYIRRVTYPEGISLKKFAEITEKKFGIDSDEFLDYINSPQIRKRRHITARTSEGYLMPSTYDFYANPTLQNIAKKLFDTQDKIWKKYAHRAKLIGWSRHKTLTLASIIEAETPIPEERSRISGVYHNRLNKGMLLQADPTVQYALGGKKRLLFRDLKINNPYNTYLYKGLPPGPINSPSESSIRAALYPEKNNFIFFVAKGDGSMRHNFARTHNEHLTFVAKYRKNLGSHSKF